MIEQFAEIVAHLPFILMVDGKAHMNKTRIVEFLILAGILGGVMYSELGHIKNSIAELKVDVKEMKRDLYTPAGERDHWGTRPGKTQR